MTKRIEGEKKTAEEAMNYWLDSAIFSKKRTPKDASDFGDNGTVGCCMKRRYLTFGEYQQNLDFGLYFGQHGKEWVVGIINDDGRRLVAAETFNSLAELKEAWELD